MTDMVAAGQEVQGQKEEFRFTKHTKVTPENFKDFASKIYNSGHRCLKSLQVVGDYTTFQRIVEYECVVNQIPMVYLLEGAYRQSNKSLAVTYYGDMACRLVHRFAREQDLPTLKNESIQYIVDDLEKVVADQGKYILDQNKVIIPHHMVYGLDLLEFKKPFLYVLKKTYSVIGVYGSLVMSDGEVYSYLYSLDKEKTKADNSPYGLYPLQFLQTKFRRHAMTSYYKIRLDSTIDTVDEQDNIVTVEEIADREEELSAKEAARLEKLASLKNKYNK